MTKKTFEELCQLSQDLYFSPFKIKDFITPEQQEFCLGVYDESPIFEAASHERATRKDSQMHANYGPSALKEIFLPKLEKIFSHGINCDGSNFTEWHSPVSIHTDGYQLAYIDKEQVEANQDILGFVVLVPLRTNTGKGIPRTVMFNQKYYGSGVNIKAPGHAKDSPVIDNVDLIEGYTHCAFDKQHPDYAFVDHLSDERLHGFSIDTVFEWHMRDALVWHRSQFHCSAKFNEFNSKTHLIFFCNFKVAK